MKKNSDYEENSDEEILEKKFQKNSDEEDYSEEDSSE